MLLCLGDQAVHVVKIAEDWIDILVVGNIVAVVILRRTVDRGKPDGVDAQIFQIVKSADDAREIADAVAVGILKTLWVNLIDDCFFSTICYPCV